MKLIKPSELQRKLPDSLLRSGTIIYEGSIFGKRFTTGHNAIIRERNKIGNNVLIGTNTYLGLSNIIKNNVRIHTACFLENVTLEENVIVGPHVVFTNDRFPPCKKCVEIGRTKVGKNTVIGANATILPGITIGSNCLIGAGTVVTKNVENNLVMVGNPGRTLRKNKKHLHQ